MNEELFENYFLKKLSQEEMKQLKQVLMENEEARRNFIAFSQERGMLIRILGRMKNAAEQAVPQKEPQKRSRKRHRVPSNPGWLWIPIAACIAIIVGSFYYNHLQAQRTSSLVRAQLIQTTSGVTIFRHDKDFPAETGMDILLNDMIRTRQGAQAKFKYDNEDTIIDLQAATVLKLREDNGAKRIEITSGTIRCKADKQPPDKPIIFITPHARVMIIGTRLVLSVGIYDRTPGASTCVEVQEGRVLFTNTFDAQSVEVTAGYYAVSEQGEKLVVLPIEKPSDTLLEDDFETGKLSLWDIPQNSPWQVIKDPDKKNMVLTAEAQQSTEQSSVYSSALQCGDQTWSDYTVETSIRFDRIAPIRDGVIILARVTDENNFYWLEYTVIPQDQFMTIWRRHKGKDRELIGSIKVKRPEPGTWYCLKFEVKGHILRGFLDEELIVETEDPYLTTGRIGITRARLIRGEKSVILWDDLQVRSLAGTQ